MKRLTLGLLLFTMSAMAADWPPVNPADLAAKTPRVEPDADAEALLWDVRTSHEIHGPDVEMREEHYIRIKIFNDRGRERFTTIDLEYADHEHISDISGRTIRPNGEIVELKKDAVYERVIAKGVNLKVKVKSFAMPAVEAGSIIEYRWRKGDDPTRIRAHYRLDFQRDIPVQEVRYHIKPLVSQYFPYDMRSINFSLKTEPFTKEADGYYTTSAKNIPSFKDEPDMPSRADVRAWMLLYYTENQKTQPDKYWEALGRKNYDNYKRETKITDEMRAAAADAVKGATTDDAKARALYDYVRKNFKDTGDSDSEGPRIEKPKEIYNTSDTFKQKAGNGYQIILLYLALAESQGLEARLARMTSRNFGAFNKNFLDPYFLITEDAAVKINGEWKFCDPSSRHLPFGMLSWAEEGQVALISDSKQPLLMMTPVAAPAESMIRRQATLKLNEEGVLEGDVSTEYTGHTMAARKPRYRRESPAEREESVRKEVKARFAGADVTNIKIESSDDPSPLKISYHVKIDGYAERTGKRLFLKVSFFSRDRKPRFTTSDRKYPILLEYAWGEKDDITYQLPAGYSLEKGESPQPMNASGVADYAVKMAISKSGQLTFDRTMNFGLQGAISFPLESYGALKKVFERFQETDDHTLIVKLDSTTGGAN